MTSPPLLEIRDVSACFGRTTVLDRVSLSLASREVIAITGRNGAGKSTILKSIIGLANVTCGTIALEGWCAEGRQPYEIARRGVAYMPQGGRVFPRSTVLQNLRLAAKGAVKTEGRLEQVLDLVPLLSELGDRIAGLLSGGERQLLALSMALVRRRRLLLLDEPFAGVEKSIKEVLVSSISSILRAEDLAALIVEHDSTVVAALATRTCKVLEHKLEWID